MLQIPPTQTIWQALDEVKDPEIPVVSVVEMGIVRAVEVSGENITVTMTPTFSGCPALHVMKSDIVGKLGELGFEHVEVKTILSPPWSTDWITAAAKDKLRDYGITPPAPAGDDGLIQLELSPSQCPRCGSFDTRTRNTFGPTLCKSIHTCNSCREPFEAFKSL
ncbi:phenylacetate-CoA oxygenase subunit PaaJ [soil metagenome]